MKNRAMWFYNLFLIVVLISLPVWQMKAFGEMRATGGIETAGFAKKHINKLQETAGTFRELAGQPIPAKLSADESREAERHTKWLKDCSQRLDELANRWQSGLGKIEKNQDLLVAQKQLMEMNQSFNMQYLALQEDMQNESRRFSLLSNIMKTKHDTAKNSISNLR